MHPGYSTARLGSSRVLGAMARLGPALGSESELRPRPTVTSMFAPLPQSFEE